MKKSVLKTMTGRPKNHDEKREFSLLAVLEIMTSLIYHPLAQKLWGTN